MAEFTEQEIDAAADAVVADHGGEVPTLETFKKELAQKLTEQDAD